MMTTKNYFDKINTIDLSSLPEPIQKGHEYVVKATKNGQDWGAYKSSEAVKKVIDLYLEKLNQVVRPPVKQGAGNKPSKHNKTNADTGKYAHQSTEHLLQLFEAAQNFKTHEAASDAANNKALRELTKELKKRGAYPSTASSSVQEKVQLSERISEELKLIKRFMALIGKSKTKEQILRFINSLQKAIVEKRVRKTSPYADRLLFIQDKIIEIYNSMKNKITIELKDETYSELKALTGEEKVYPSINFIKRYISMNEKPGIKEKAKLLLQQINNALNKGKITDNDPYTSEILGIKQNLSEFISAKARKTLQIEKNTLNGLEGILGCACEQSAGLGSLPPVMNSVDFAKLEFNTIGLQGKWYELIGDPSSNFTAMVFGKPKMGKSFLCIDFAGYLARNHGKVLYVAKEEGLDLTLQSKLQETGVQHPNLYVASELPLYLSNYDFIFLDSVNKLGLTPNDLTSLKRKHPAKSFIFIFQTTKDGRFRGANTFQHDVDVVIEVPEKGKAVQMGRFNQGGEMQIFHEAA